MYGMAAIASYFALGMGRAPDVSAIVVLAMAAETSIENFAWSEEGKRHRNGRLASASFHMTLSRSVAALTSGFFHWLLTGSQAFVVRISKERLPNIRMTDLANRASNKTTGLGRCDGIGQWLR